MRPPVSRAAPSRREGVAPVVRRTSAGRTRITNSHPRTKSSCTLGKRRRVAAVAPLRLRAAREAGGERCSRRVLRAGEVPNLGRCIARQAYRDHVDAQEPRAWDERRSELAQRVVEACDVAVADRALRRRVRGAGLHLDRGVHAAAPDQEIDLAVARAEIARDAAPAERGEMRRGQILAEPAARRRRRRRLSRRCRRRAPSSPSHLRRRARSRCGRR